MQRMSSSSGEAGGSERQETGGAGVGCENLSHRGEVFRSKLIEGFQILDCVTEEGREKAPVYNSSDTTGTAYSWTGGGLAVCES